MPYRHSVVIIQRSRVTRLALARAFEEQGCVVYDTAYIDAARQWLDRERGDAVLTDWFPDTRRGTAEFVRQYAARMPIFVLTLAVPLFHKVASIRAGVIHFLPDSCLFPELLAWLERALVGRTQVVQAGRCCLDLDSGRLEIDGTQQHLVGKECAVLAELMRHPDILQSKETLLAGMNSAGENTLQAYIKRLRHKHPYLAACIRTKYRQGYYWQERDSFDFGRMKK